MVVSDGRAAVEHCHRGADADLVHRGDNAERDDEERDRVETRAHQAKEVLAARCPSCEYVYEVAAGDEHEGFAAGTAWADIPDDWCCPDCGVREKIDFVPLQREAAS